MPLSMSSPFCPRIRSATSVPDSVLLLLPPTCTFTSTLALDWPSLPVVCTVELPVRPETVLIVAVRVSPLPAKVTLLFGTRRRLDEMAPSVRRLASPSTSLSSRVTLALLVRVSSLLRRSRMERHGAERQREEQGPACQRPGPVHPDCFPLHVDHHVSGQLAQETLSGSGTGIESDFGNKADAEARIACAPDTHSALSRSSVAFLKSSFYRRSVKVHHALVEGHGVGDLRGRVDRSDI